MCFLARLADRGWMTPFFVDNETTFLDLLCVAIVVSLGSAESSRYAPHLVGATAKNDALLALCAGRRRRRPPALAVGAGAAGADAVARPSSRRRHDCRNGGARRAATAAPTQRWRPHRAALAAVAASGTVPFFKRSRVRPRRRKPREKCMVHEVHVAFRPMKCAGQEIYCGHRRRIARARRSPIVSGALAAHVMHSQIGRAHV